MASASTTFSWSLDAAGNFNSVTANGTVINRTHNKQNEVTQLGGTNLGFDGNGNTTSDNYGKTLVYDAWNRLVAYKNGATTLESMQYDGLNRRIVANPGTATDLYYSSDWRMLEEQVGGVTKVQYVWSPVYVDALILRDRDADGNAANGLEERLYAQQDANWNVTALLNTSGTVVERYAYDPYGYVAAFLNASWGTLSGSAYAWIYLHQGGRFDGTSNLYYFRNRDYSPTLGRWMRVDPIGFAAGDVNLYRYVENRPANLLDPNGTDWLKCFTDCLEDNDPIPFIIGKALALLSGTPVPKTWVAELADLVGDAQLARSIRSSLNMPGVSPYTTIPSSLSAKLRLGGKNVLRSFGRVALPVMVVYGLALAVVVLL